MRLTPPYLLSFRVNAFLQSITPDVTIATEVGNKAAFEPPIDMLNDDPELS
jgi:hypothetical protein